MKKFQVLSVIAVLLAGVGLLTAGAQATSYTWSNSLSGNWNDPVNWLSNPAGSAGRSRPGNDGRGYGARS